MKPFDLEAAKRGEPIVCRDGTPAKFVRHDPELGHAGLIVIVDGCVQQRFTDGTDIVRRIARAKELVMAPKKSTVWVNFYNHNFATFFNTQEEADRDNQETQFDIDRLGNRAYPVEIEE